ncbi:unnamed protein product [Meloidogyne enterolobii]|uniref:Uncharacterized protein n=2 Tax=Meloidogyne enterolobii TaxID=390850 RepID=A0ACB0YU63_MELEN
MPHFYLKFLFPLILLNLSPLLIKSDLCKFPTAKGNQTVDETIPLTKDKDFGFIRLIASPKLGSCTIDFSKKMSPILWLSNGVTVSNLIIGTESSSGIWCSGSCTLKNVYFERVCTHAAAFNATTDFTKTDRRSFTYTVEGGAGLHALDKMFVQSGPGKTIINNFCGDGFQKVWRSCGTCNDEVSQNSKQRTVFITNSNFTGKGHVIASGNAPYNDKVSFNNVKIFGYKNRSTRVVYACGEVRPEISEDHLDTGASNWYLPGHAGTGPVCNYPASAVKIVN